MFSTEIIDTLADPATAASVLTTLADQTGDRRYARAAGVLRGRTGGRPVKQDYAALERVAALLADGTAASIPQAARFVARAFWGEESSIAAAGRLERKFRARQI
jgi:hypothetical protein